MTSKEKAGAVAVGVAALGGALYLLFGKKAEAAPPGGGAGPSPVPGPGGAAGYRWPAGFDLRSAIVAQANAKGIPAWLALGTAIAEDGLRFPPTNPKLEQGGYGATFYPMGIKSGTIATALGRGPEWAGNPQVFDAIGYDIPAQVDAAVRLLKSYWLQAQALRSQEMAAHAVRVAWQSGNMVGVLNTGRLPEWYTAMRAGAGQSFQDHFTAAVRAAGGPDIARPVA